MAPKLALVSMLALALLAGTSAVAPATAFAQTATDTASLLDQAQNQYDAAEASYTAAAGGDASGFTGQIQQLATAGQTGPLDQLVQARESARTNLQAAIGGYLNALQAQHDALAAAGKNDQAQSVQGAMDDLHARLQALAADAASEKLAAKGAAPASASTTPAATSPSLGPTVAGTGAGLGYSSDNTKPAAVANAPRAPETPAAPKPRKATGRLVLVPRGDSLETTLERLDRACERMRSGQAPLDDELEMPSGEVEVYLVEKWRDAAPVRIKLAKDDAHVTELLRLRNHPGATCSIEGQPQIVVKGTRTEGAVLELRDWKLLALAAADRLVPAARAAEASKKPAPVAPGPLAPEDENFND